ncbi:ATP-binding protein [Leptolyngbya sp. NIES-2104]|uniref:ATP-binding protein n=1 Tax=Leptolyngbya sp. NIES-2104 TaxID=1552121 RepID=UPI0006EC70C8|nr:ATP-binding protein [Leptolyngbya sp. NIES-2104]GAP98052.1 hypothetical protein NIES2104_46050 [Leptolyngbya sp. NIES-2104]
MRFATISPEQLYLALSEDAVLLLGAGASLKSGIPLSGDIVERAAKWSYCRSKGCYPDDPTVRRSDWLPWLEQQPWYKVGQSTADNYSATIENLLQPKENRRDFFLHILKPNVPPSYGYEYLVELLAKKVIKTVLTSNFDEVLPDLCRTRSNLHHIEVIKTSADYIKLSTSPRYPQLIYLHGSVEHYTDKNLIDEIQRLDEKLVTRLVPILRDHPLIVVGYRGAEPSIMHHLLIEQAEAADYFPRGIFWCARSQSIASGLHPMVRQLADTIGNNLQVVQITGFDELFADFQQFYEVRQPSVSFALTSLNSAESAFSALTFDMKHLKILVSDLDWFRVQEQIVTYCQNLQINVPSPVTREWLIQQMCKYDLAVQQDEEIQPTIAGYLLFATNPDNQIAGAVVRLQIDGEESVRVIRGNLWYQQELITDILEEINRPFRLKGTISETVRPYPVIALKELLVNALVHRQYEDSRTVTIHIGANFIRITNPGGLVAEIAKLVEERGRPIQEEIERSGRGIKGYRNPVIADLFYGSGAMDKQGSGLADVQEEVNKSGGKVVFGPVEDNSAFEVILYCRPEAVDIKTGTAVPLVSTERYIANLIEIVSTPPYIWHASTSARRVKEIWERTGAKSLPPFVLYDERLYSISDLANPNNPLSTQIDHGDLEQLSLEEFATGSDGERRFVHLLNECLYRHLQACDLEVDKKRKRAYFARPESGGSREITYQARVRQATRTVTKPIISKTTQRLRYWEHEAVYFSVERYGDVWAIQLVPSYVFTVDGRRKLVDSAKVTALVTRRASHDYNAQVQNHIFFWAWVLGRSQDSFTLNAGCEHSFQLRGSLPFCETHDVLPMNDEPEEDDALKAASLEEVEDELYELIEAERLFEEATGAASENGETLQEENDVITY